MPHLQDLDFRFRRRPTQLVTDLDALACNVATLRARCPNQHIYAVLKADGYGHGMLRCAHRLAELNVAGFAVAVLEEAVALRQSGIEAPILVLGGLVGYQVKHFLDYHLDITASSLYKAQQISEAAVARKVVARVHLKIDTGMNRIGVRSQHAFDFVQAVSQLPGLHVVGIFSHFCGSETPDDAFTGQQIADFRALLDRLDAVSLRPEIAHMANSGAIAYYSQSHLDAIRPGISLFGVAPSDTANYPLDLKPVLSVCTQVVYMKGLRQGQCVGYGRTWCAPEDGWLATLPVGYGDGYPRALSNRADVLIAGKRYPIVGQISMDQTTVWLGKDKVEVGDDVTLLGRDGEQEITAWELARSADTIAYEILCGWTSRVARTFLPS